MGCTASKLGNEDSVRRCKERRRLMKEAVVARHHLAAAHSDYCRSLKATGSALAIFSSGEPLSVADQTPAVLLPTRSSASTTTTTAKPSVHSYQTPSPVPVPAVSRSTSVASSKLPPILSAAPSRTAAFNQHQRRPKPTVKLPHILSESSEASYSPRENATSSSSRKTGQYDDNSDMRMVIRHRDLTEIVASIKEYFDKAADAGEQVSEMLETGRAQLDRSFRQLKKTVYHSSGVLSNLSSSWTSKPPLAIKYRFEPGSIGEPGGSKSLCSTLDRLLAWEMKLYQEVKAREGVKIEHERKLSALQSQEYKGEEESKLNKTKASIKKLQSLIVVTSQAVSTTSTAIVGLRDAELVPQLIELCHGFMYMWRSMNQCHEVQNHVVQQVRGLVNRSTKGESTSDLHRQATRDLEAAVSAWHTSFCRLIKFQRDFIKSLQGWFKLTLLPINTEEANINGSQPSDVYIVFDEWKLALDRLPDTVASEAIKSFINVVHSISLKQAEEMKVKKRTESASKELEKKASSLRNIEKKYYHSYSMVGLGLPDNGQDEGHGLDARDPLSEKKTELVACQRRVEDEMLKHSKAVEVTRSMTLNNIQTGLPGVFQAMSSFSGLIMEALEVVCNKSYAVK
ncbi:hypothetical protein L1987_39301 [Smallanthus sonchifolius]|uniref:Uncharacterized protein n=1 Tax=Smallanthus sonchifolius TaxID=185202 RepID=A0ACB9HMT5_9ASTR|nr:hypothetical protein L1987_39301 [Smallanthus sonchifolius]